MIGDSVQIYIPEDSSELDRKRVAGACEAALGRGHCVVESDNTPGFAPQWRAQVTRGSDGAFVILLSSCVSLARCDQMVGERHLEFAEEDPGAFRFQSVGVVVAAMVLAQPEPVAQTQEKLDPATPEPPAEAVTTATSNVDRPHSRLFVDLGAAVTPGVSSPYPGAGAMFAVTWQLPVPLLVHGGVEATGGIASLSATTLTGTSVTGSLGIGQQFALIPDRIGVEARLAGSVQWLHVRAEDELGEENSTPTRFGGRLGALFFYRFRERWGAFLGGDIGVFSPAIVVEVAGRESTSFGNVWWSGHGGLRFWAFP